MAAAPTPSTEPAADVLVRDAVSAAEGYRAAAKIITGALAALPLVTLFTSLLKLPEGSAWDEGRLWFAGGLIVLSLVSGLLASVSLSAPIDLRDTDPAIADFNMARLPEVPAEIDSFSTLRSQYRELLQQPKRNPLEDRDLKNHDAAIKNVYRLATADAMRERAFALWPTWVLTAFALITGMAAVVNLLLAPTTPTDKEAADIGVVTVTLEKPAVTKFGCEVATFDALRIGGTTEKPLVVPLKQECATNVLELRAKIEPNASVSDVKPAKG